MVAHLAVSKAVSSVVRRAGYSAEPMAVLMDRRWAATRAAQTVAHSAESWAAHWAAH